MAGASIGDKFGAAALDRTACASIDPAKVSGTLTVAFVAQQRVGARGLQRILSTMHADEMIYVGPTAARRTLCRACRACIARRAASLAAAFSSASIRSSGELSGFAADLKQLADANKIPLATDYSAGITPASYFPPPAFPGQMGAHRNRDRVARHSRRDIDFMTPTESLGTFSKLIPIVATSASRHSARYRILRHCLSEEAITSRRVLRSRYDSVPNSSRPTVPASTKSQSLDSSEGTSAAVGKAGNRTMPGT